MADCMKCANYNNDYCIFACKNGEGFKPITNADHMRTMTDEELAEFLAMCDASRFRMRCDTEEVRAETWRWLEWLKQEVDR